MNTILEEIRRRIKAASDNTDEAGDYDEYATGQGVGLATALRIIDEMEKEHPVPSDIQEAAKKYADERLAGNNRELAESGHTRHFKMGYVCFAGYEIEEAFEDGAEWQAVKDGECHEESFEEGAMWERERLMKEAVSMDITDDTQWEDVDRFVHKNCDGSVKLIILK